MQLIFGNPYGWWALLLLPALVLVHCLHVNRRPRIISTLFLVRDASTQRHGGRTFVFWKHSLTFWLQVLAALLLTWLLLQPRWLNPQTSQQIVFVLDSSLSMDAFRQNALRELDSASHTLAAGAARTRWLLTDSAPRPQVLYSGASREQMLAAAAQWHPALGTHDWQPAIASARTLAGAEAPILFVTDHLPQQRPHDMHLLSVGTPLPNTGFTGLQTDPQSTPPSWRTLVKNYSDQPVQRQWWIEIGEERLPPRTLDIPANGSVLLSGQFPANTQRMTLVLEEDAWPLDNRLPLVLPQPKQLNYQLDEQTQALAPLLESMPDTRLAGSETLADLSIRQVQHPIATAAVATTTATSGADTSAQATAAATTADAVTSTADAVTPSTQNASSLLINPAADNARGHVVFIHSTDAASTAATQANGSTTAQQNATGTADSVATNTTTEDAANNAPAVNTAAPALPPVASRVRGVVSATAHPLNEGLNWSQIALPRGVPPLTLGTGDTPLAWLGSAPLIWINEQHGKRTLVFNFAPQEGNALRLPATVLLINRFAELLREEKPGYEAANTELGQSLRVSLPANTGEAELNGQSLRLTGSRLLMNAPATPAFFNLSADGQPLLDGAAHFADVREADLRHAASHSDAATVKHSQQQANSTADSLRPWWLLLLAAALLASWYYAERGR